MEKFEYFLAVTAPILLTLITCGITLFAEKPERLGMIFIYVGVIFGSIWLVGMVVLLIMEKYIEIVEEKRLNDIKKRFR
ncbi:hypothetical protein [Vibrio sp. HN007]|uniref:hypothetical protein n=1 Tax=Vibrio iocasae TaxID=3098914 RepID=UPI0035D45607